MKYKDYSLYDFLKDKFFVDWVKKPTMESDLFWKSWMEDNPEKEIEKAKELLLSIKYREAKIYQTELNDSLEHILRKAEEFDLELKPAESSKYYLIKWATSIALFLMAVTFTYFILKSPESQDLTKSVYVLRETSPGMKSTIKLSDGTTVSLNSNTKLKAPERFLQNTREVFLEGEAYFQVKKDSRRPFIIHTDDMQIKVLGTSFNVRSFLDEAKIQVALGGGKVEAHSNIVNNEAAYSIILSPNEMLTYSKSINKLNKDTFDLDEIVGWKDDKIVFQKASFNKVVSKLQNWYGGQFIIEGRPNNETGFSSTFQGKSLLEVLQGMSSTSGFK
ncbi:MAG: FecR family protein [Flammeovirgaceae bacterium]|nr:FecR family protein [Flammeovirgaceae bacterium]